MGSNLPGGKWLTDKLNNNKFTNGVGSAFNRLLERFGWSNGDGTSMGWRGEALT